MGNKKKEKKVPLRTIKGRDKDKKEVKDNGGKNAD